MEVFILGARGFFCAVSGVSCLYCDPRCDRRIDLDRHCLLLIYTMRLFAVSRGHVTLELSWIGHSLWYLMWTQFVNYPVSYANTLLLTLQKSSIMASLFQNLINVIRYCTWSSLLFYSNTTSRSERSYPSCHPVPKILPYYPVLRDLHWLPVHLRIEFKILLNVQSPARIISSYLHKRTPSNI